MMTRDSDWRSVPIGPRLTMVSAVALFGATAFAQDPLVGPQIRIDVGGGLAAANETTGSASEIAPNRILGGWNDYRDSGFIRSGFSLSVDGGKTWNDFLLRPPLGFQANTEGDPMVAHDDRTGTLWAAAISFDISGGIYVARLNPGQTVFEPPVMADTGFIDKGWMAAGPRPGEPDSTRLYITYNAGIIWSDDLGDTWTAPASLGFGLGFLPRVGPQGELYVAYWDVGTGVLLQRSLNGGASFTTHTIATRMDVWDAQEGTRFPGTFRVPPLTYLDVDPNDGTLYAVYFDTTDIVNGQSNVDLYFTRSTNQGTTWTTPVVINNDADRPGDQFFPWIEVDQCGRIHIVFLDSRHTVQDDDVPNGKFDAYYTYSADGGDNWTEFRLTPASWSSNGSTFVGDYLGMAVAGNRVYPVYVDMGNGDQDVNTNVIVFPSPDVNDDGIVNVLDLIDLLLCFGLPAAPGCEGEDVNGDGTIDVLDLIEVLVTFGLTPCG